MFCTRKINSRFKLKIPFSSSESGSSQPYLAARRNQQGPSGERERRSNGTAAAAADDLVAEKTIFSRKVIDNSIALREDFKGTAKSRSEASRAELNRRRGICGGRYGRKKEPPIRNHRPHSNGRRGVTPDPRNHTRKFSQFAY